MDAHLHNLRLNLNKQRLWLVVSEVMLNICGMSQAAAAAVFVKAPVSGLSHCLLISWISWRSPCCTSG